jgi:hypothetical protein
MTTLNPGRSRTLTASFFAADGKPARVDGDPVWGVSDPAVAELVDTSSAFSKKVRAIGPGTCEVTCTADADLGEGIRELVLRAAFVVPEPEATGGEMAVGDEEVPPRLSLTRSSSRRLNPRRSPWSWTPLLSLLPKPSLRRRHRPPRKSRLIRRVIQRPRSTTDLPSRSDSKGRVQPARAALPEKSGGASHFRGAFERGCPDRTLQAPKTGLRGP